MRFTATMLLTCALLQASHAYAEDAGEYREKGIQALKDSQQDQARIVDAARCFMKAEALFERAGDEEKAVEMNSFLFWCKKKMTREDIDRFTQGAADALTEKLKGIEENNPRIEDAQKWVDRAEQYATSNPTEHFLIAIRFFEIALRFKGSDISLAAQDRSLSEQGKSMERTGVRSVAQVSEEAPRLRPIPLSEKLKDAEKSIKELFKDDYIKNDNVTRRLLCAKRLQQADENLADAATEYVLTREACDLAVAGGDCAGVNKAFARLKSAFVIDFTALTAELRRSMPNARAPDAAAALATMFALVGEEALARDNAEQAVHAYAQAEELSPYIKDAALKTHLRNDSLRVQTAKRESAAAAVAFKTLTQKPDDPAANLVAGRFLLSRGDFGKSAALLAKCGDEKFSNLARLELAGPREAEMQVIAGDAWVERSEKESALKSIMRERAAMWYAKAMPSLQGVAKLKLEERLKKLAPVVSESSQEIALDLGGGVKIEMVLVKSGEFNMGDDNDQDRPIHKVRISQAFYIGKFDITVAQFKAFVQATQFQTDAEKIGKARTFKNGKFEEFDHVDWRNPGFKQEDTHPVVVITWNDAQEFCKWATMQVGRTVRLPSEAEWEYAARGPNSRKYPWGDHWRAMSANAADNSLKAKGYSMQYGELKESDGYAFTSPVGTYKIGVSWCGALDMAGNVWQWCEDRHTYGYYGESPAIDPPGPTGGNNRVRRGGSWNNGTNDCHSFGHNHTHPTARASNNGFRVVVAAKER